MSDSFFMGKPGQMILVKTNRAITGASLVRLKIEMPDLTKVVWTPSSYNLTTGDITYITDGTTDITQIGEYVVQAYVELNGTALPPGKKGYFHCQKAIY